MKNTHQCAKKILGQFYIFPHLCEIKGGTLSKVSNYGASIDSLEKKKSGEKNILLTDL